MNRISQSLVLIGIAVTAPVWAVSVPETADAQPPRSAAAPSNQYVAVNMTPGSAALVPLMAVEMEANHAAAVDAPADRRWRHSRSTTSRSSGRPRKIRARKSSQRGTRCCS